MIYRFNQLIQSSKIYIRILLSWQSIITFGLAALATILYYWISWTYAQVFLAKIMASLFSFYGHSVLQINDCLVIDDISVRFTNHCTYINRILIGLPFVWRRDGIRHNILRIFEFVGAVSTINIFRIYFALTWHTQGIPWKYSHTFFTHLISWSIFILIVTLWLKSLKISQEN